MDNLKNAREGIDQIDNELRELFEKRLDLVQIVLEYKKANAMQIFDGSREKEVIDKNCTRLQNKKYLNYYIDFIRNLMSLSKEYQSDLLLKDKIGYQGVPGGFGHIVANKLFENEYLKKYPTFKEVFNGLINKEIIYGIVPFENSYAGDVDEVLDLLFENDIYINKIYYQKIDQCLLGIKGSVLKDIKMVSSHPQAINQCLEFIKEHDYQIEYASNTAQAAKKIATTKDISKGAIGSIEAAQLYGLSVLKANINTSKDNQTKFAVLSPKMSLHGNRLAIMFTVKQRSGQLAEVLEIIAKLGLDMECIKSRAIKRVPWQYYFYVEIVGNIEDEKVKILIDKMTNKCKTFKVVGTYDVE